MTQAYTQTGVQQIPSQCRNQPHWKNCRCHAHLQALNCLLCDVAILCMPPDFLCMRWACSRHTLLYKVCLPVILFCQLHPLMACHECSLDVLSLTSSHLLLNCGCCLRYYCTAAVYLQEGRKQYLESQMQSTQPDEEYSHFCRL